MQPQKHILVLSSWYPNPKQPFLGNFIQRQAHLLSEVYQVSVIHSFEDKNSNEVRIEKKSTECLKEIRIHIPPIKSIFKKRKEQIRSFKKALQSLDNVDLIIGSIALPKAWQFLLAKKHFNCPLFYTEQGSYFRPEIKNKWKFPEKFLLRKLNKKADAIFPVSYFLKKDMLPFFSEKKMTVIGNSVDENLFSLSPDIENEKTHFLHISTLDEKTKNPMGIINAIELLSNKTGEFVFTFVCDENATKWEKIIQEKGLESYVYFEGPVHWETIPSYYHKADAFVLFSNYETFSIVLAEAWTTGTPCITTPVGIAENIDESLGVTVQPENEQQLANEMFSFIQQKKKYDKEQIRAHAHRFFKKEILKQWEQAIEKIFQN